MLEFVLAAALLFDPVPLRQVALRPAPPPVQPSVSVASVPVLTSVAVTLECTARASGRVENCKVLAETHPDLGFGEAAIALMMDAEVARGMDDVQFARTIQFMP